MDSDSVGKFFEKACKQEQKSICLVMAHMVNGDYMV